MADFSIELTGTPDDVQAMRNVASRIDGAKAYREKKITDGHYIVWYRASEAPNDLLAAIKRKAGLTKSKPRSKARSKGGKVDPGVLYQVNENTPEISSEDSNDGDV